VKTMFKQLSMFMFMCLFGCVLASGCDDSQSVDEEIPVKIIEDAPVDEVPDAPIDESEEDGDGGDDEDPIDESVDILKVNTTNVVHTKPVARMPIVDLPVIETQVIVTEIH